MCIRDRIKIINIVALMIVPIVPITMAKPMTGAAEPVAIMAVAVPVAKVFFVTGSADLPTDTGVTLAGIVAFAKAHPDAKLAVSGFHDPSGNQAANEEVSKNRAKAVSNALKEAGIAEERIELKKPEVTTGSGDSAEARRVEVSAK